VDLGITEPIADRLELARQKAILYADYVASGEAEQDYPGKKASDFYILYLTPEEAPAEIATLTKVASADPEGVTLDIFFHVRPLEELADIEGNDLENLSEELQALYESAVTLGFELIGGADEEGEPAAYIIAIGADEQEHREVFPDFESEEELNSAPHEFVLKLAPRPVRAAICYLGSLAVEDEVMDAIIIELHDATEEKAPVFAHHYVVDEDSGSINDLDFAQLTGETENILGSRE
jgi:hypothetical protein